MSGTLVDVAVLLEHRPGALAELGEALGAAGVSLEGGGVFVHAGAGVAHFLVDDGPAAEDALRAAGLEVTEVREPLLLRLRQGVPGQLGTLCRRLADAGVQIEVQYSDHDGQLVLLVRDRDLPTARRVAVRWEADGGVPVRTRPPQPDDALPLARMVDRAWRATYATMLPPAFWDSYPTARRADDLRASIDDPAQRGLVAQTAAGPVGWALRGPSRAGTVGVEPARTTELYSLYVDAPGAGLGQRLLDELLDGEPAELWVFEANVSARRFYERNGFAPDGARHVYRPGTADLPEVRLVR